jgi:hypothetical protein
MNKIEKKRWAAAIAARISEEWEGAKTFPEDAILLRAFLQKSLMNDGSAIASFIGTGVIETDYFQPI